MHPIFYINKFEYVLSFLVMLEVELGLIGGDLLTVNYSLTAHSDGCMIMQVASRMNTFVF